MPIAVPIPMMGAYEDLRCIVPFVLDPQTKSELRILLLSALRVVTARIFLFSACRLAELLWH